MKRILIFLVMAAVAGVVYAQSIRTLAVWTLGEIRLSGTDSTYHAAIYLGRGDYPDSTSLFLFLKGDSVVGSFRHADSTKRRISVISRLKYSVPGLPPDTVANMIGVVVEDSVLLNGGMRVYRLPYTRPMDSLIIDFSATLGPNIDTTGSGMLDSIENDITGFLRIQTLR